MGKIKFQPLFMVYVFLCIYFNWFNKIFYYVVSVVLHEYGHYFVARLLGYEANGITFNVYGAGLNTSNIYKKRDDIIISLAGPIVNVIFIVLIICFWWIVPSTYMFTYGFFESNLIVMFFNLLPIYPLDGGRVLFALTTNRGNREKRIKINSRICFALGIIFIALFFVSIFFSINFNFLFIGLFLSGNSIIYDKSGYFSNAKTWTKDDTKVHEVKLFKVKDFDKKTLLRYVSPHYYAVFISASPRGYKMKSEEEIFKM